MSESIATSMEKYAIVAGTEKAVGSVIIRKVRCGIFGWRAIRQLFFLPENDTTEGKTRQFLRLTYGNTYASSR
jgi:hypothetical protein